jgi:hypothetical protein
LPPAKYDAQVNDSEPEAMSQIQIIGFFVAPPRCSPWAGLSRSPSTGGLITNNHSGASHFETTIEQLLEALATRFAASEA